MDYPRSTKTSSLNSPVSANQSRINSSRTISTVWRGISKTICMRIWISSWKKLRSLSKSIMRKDPFSLENLRSLLRLRCLLYLERPIS